MKLESLRSRHVARRLYPPIVTVAGCAASLFVTSCAAPPIPISGANTAAHSSVTLVAVGDAPRLYGGQIVLSARAGAELKKSVGDLRDTLQEMTGHTFAAQTVPATARVLPARGIVLLHSDSDLVPADIKEKLAGKGREPFYLRSDGGELLTIVANHDDGLSHGLYYFLEQLGVRYYFPTEKWTIVPRRAAIVLKEDRLIAPAFKLHDFFGSGGFGQNLPVDPQNTVSQQWENWKRRNRFGGEFSLGGHSGEAFNSENKAILQEHPEYLAKVDGKYVPLSASAKLNVANPDAVKLYTDWIVAKFRKTRLANPKARIAFAASLEPSDGPGHCNSEECRAIGNGSPSDQIFYLANQAAKAVRKEFPDAWVNLYAYNLHAAVPSFPLEPNVYVQVIPYAFQQSGYPPEALIAQWEAKAERLGIYDYWALPDWNYDAPSFNYLRTPQEKIRFWHAHKIEGFLGESTASAGAVGLAWYLASRLLWNPATDTAPLVDEFYVKAFGPARAPMQRMMERWAKGFVSTSQELAVSYRDVQEALQLSQNDADVRARVLDYGRYLHYLRLYFEMQQTKPQSPERNESALKLMRYVMGIQDSAMISSFRIFQGINRYNTTDWQKNWTQVFATPDARHKEAGPGWNDISLLGDEQIAALVEDGAKQYANIIFEPQSYEGDLMVLPPSLTGAPTAEFSPPLTLQNTIRLEAVVSNDQKQFALRLQRTAAATDADVRVTVMADDFKVVSSEVAQLKVEAPTDVEIALPHGGHYYLDIGGGNQSFRLQTPSNVPLVMRLWANHPSQPAPRLYFYVPRGLKKLAIYKAHEAVQPPVVLDSRGQVVAVDVQTDASRLLIYPVEAGQDGKIWSLDQASAPKGFPIQLLNAPNTFSLLPATLLAPGDSMKEVQ